MPAIGPASLDEQAHRRIVVNCLAAETGVLDHFAYAIKLRRDLDGLGLGESISDPRTPAGIARPGRRARIRISGDGRGIIRSRLGGGLPIRMSAVDGSDRRHNR